MQNRIFAKACAGSSNRFGGTREMERNLSLRRTPGLGFREQTGPRSETNMGPSDLTQIHSSGRAARGFRSDLVGIRSGTMPTS